MSLQWVVNNTSNDWLWDDLRFSLDPQPATRATPRSRNDHNQQRRQTARLNNTTPKAVRPTQRRNPKMQDFDVLATKS